MSEATSFNPDLPASEAIARILTLSLFFINVCVTLSIFASISSIAQSKTISGVLKKIKESIDKITQSTNTVLNKFEDIDKGVKVVSQQEDHIRISMEEQSTGSKQILEAIGKLNDLTRQVKNSSSEMREGSKQIMDESQNLETVTSEITTAIKEMGDGTHQIGIAIKRVNDSTGDNKENITVLAEEVKKFKVE